MAEAPLASFPYLLLAYMTVFCIIKKNVIRPVRDKRELSIYLIYNSQGNNYVTTKTELSLQRGQKTVSYSGGKKDWPWSKYTDLRYSKCHVLMRKQFNVVITGTEQRKS